MEPITSLTPAQRASVLDLCAAAEAADTVAPLNEEARLSTLRIGFLILAGVSAIAAIPASRLPRYRPGDIPATN